MRWSSYFIAKERTSASSYTNRFKPITSMSADNDKTNIPQNSWIDVLDGAAYA